MAESVDVRFSSDEIKSMSLTLSDTLTWINGFQYDTRDMAPVNTDINMEPLQRLSVKLKDALFNQ